MSAVSRAVTVVTLFSATAASGAPLDATAQPSRAQFEAPAALAENRRSFHTLRATFRNVAFHSQIKGVVQVDEQRRISLDSWPTAHRYWDGQTLWMDVSAWPEPASNDGGGAMLGLLWDECRSGFQHTRFVPADPTVVGHGLDGAPGGLAWYRVQSDTLPGPVVFLGFTLRGRLQMLYFGPDVDHLRDVSVMNLAWDGAVDASRFSPQIGEMPPVPDELK